MLYKRGNVWWSYVYEDGVRHSRSTSTGNRRIAEAIDRQHKEELALKHHRLPELQPEMTFGELTARFIAEGMAKAHALDRLKHVLPFFETIEVGEINKATVRRYRQARHAATSIKVATVNRDLGVVRRLLYWALEEGIIVSNPLARMRMERERRTKRPVVSFREEALLTEAASLHLRPIILCALDTGMRRGEILSQQGEDIDYDNRILHVSHSKTPEGEMREIPLTSRLYRLLFELKEVKGTLFTFEGEALKGFKRAWAGALRRSQIRHFRFHDLRHSANTRLMLAGVMQEVRRELIGHSSRHSRDVNDRYTQIELPEKRAAIQKLDLWIEAQQLELEQSSTTAQLNSTEPQPEPQS